MHKFYHYSGTGVGARIIESSAPSNNHYTPLNKKANVIATEMGLERVAGNIYESKSRRDFWKVSENGGITRLTADEVDDGDSIPAAPKEAADDFLRDVLAALEF